MKPKILDIRLTQNNDVNPVINNVIKNDFGQITIVKASPGVFSITKTGAFPKGRTDVYFGNNIKSGFPALIQGGVIFSAEVVDNGNEIVLYTVDPHVGPVDNIFDNTPFKVVVWPYVQKIEF